MLLRTAAYAVRWKPADPSDELLTFSHLQGARNYTDYKDALSTFAAPGQNFVFADKNGDDRHLAAGRVSGQMEGTGTIRHAGRGQLLYVAGYDTRRRKSQYEAGFGEGRGFVSSANQHPADTTYPYQERQFSHLPRTDHQPEAKRYEFDHHSGYDEDANRQL